MFAEIFAARVDTIEDLRGITPGLTRRSAKVLGYSAAGDCSMPEMIGLYGAAPGTYTGGGGYFLPTGGDGSTAWWWGDISAAPIGWFEWNDADATNAIDSANEWLLLSTATSPRRLIIDRPCIYTGGADKLGGLYAAGISGITIEFTGNGKLIMDNLVAGNAPGCGIFIAGPLQDVTVVNLNVEWPTKSSTRLYHGVVFKGYPSDADCIKNVRVIGNSRIINAPNFSMLMCGVSGYEVDVLTHEGSLGDGFHVNACQNGKAGWIVGTGMGDDCAAMVNYYGVTNSSGGYPNWNTTQAEWNLLTVGDWANNNCHIAGTLARDGSATGCRIVGCKNATTGPTISYNCGESINCNSVTPDYSSSYYHLANQGVRFGNVYSHGDFVCISAQCLGAGEATTAEWTTSDVVIGDVNIQSPTHIVPVAIIDLLGVKIGKVTINATNTLQNGIVLGGVPGTTVGDIDVISADGSGNSITLAGSAATLKNSDLCELGKIRAENCAALNVILNGASANNAGLKHGDITSINCITTPIILRSIDEVNGGVVDLKEWNSGNSASVSDMIGMYLEQVRHVTYQAFRGKTSATNYYSIYMAGNTAVGQTTDVEIHNFKVRAPGADPHFFYQGGAEAPTKYAITGRYQRTDTGVWSDVTEDSY